MRKVILEINMTDSPYAEGAIVDGLSDSLYKLAEEGYIDDDNDDGWEYKYE